MKKRHLEPKATPISKPIKGREEEMKQNYAGGWGFDEGARGMVRRFVILGIDNGTYYRSEEELAEETVNAIREYAKREPQNFIELVRKARKSAMRPRNPIAAYAIGTRAMEPDAREWAYDVFGEVIRTGSDLLYFMSYVRAMRSGVGKGLRRAIARWFNERSPEELEYQMAKYQRRQGFSMVDVIRLAHPRVEGANADVVAHVLGKGEPTPLFQVIERIKGAESIAELKAILKEDGQNRITWEMIPTDPWHKRPEFWELMLPKLPTHAFLRHLWRYIGASRGAQEAAYQRLEDLNRPISKTLAGKAGHIHPGRIFDAYLALAQRQELNPAFAEALKEAFFRGFDVAVAGEPERASVGIAVDTSGSMEYSMLIRKALATAQIIFKSFSGPARDVVFFHEAAYTINTDLGQLAFEDNSWNTLSSGGTNASAAIKALRNARGPAHDLVVLITDEQSWMGDNIATSFRKHYPAGSKLVVVSLSPGTVSLTDPKDPNQVTVVGWVPEIADLVRGFLKM